MTTTNRLEELRADATYRRERRDLYRAKTLGPRATSAARLERYEREYGLAASRLKRAIGDDPRP
jgi:hypothetical protein